MRIIRLALILMLIAFGANQVVYGAETTNETVAKAPVRDVVTLFTGINRTEEIYNTLKELAPNMKAVGGPSDWRRIVINIEQGGQNTEIKINHDPAYYTGKHWQIQRNGMYNYFSKFPDAPHKQRALRIIKRLRYAVAIILNPNRIKDDQRLKLILKLSQKTNAVMFTPGSLMDRSGRIIISADGYSDPKARVDL